MTLGKPKVSRSKPINWRSGRQLTHQLKKSDMLCVLEISKCLVMDGWICLQRRGKTPRCRDLSDVQRTMKSMRCLPSAYGGHRRLCQKHFQVQRPFSRAYPCVVVVKCCWERSRRPEKPNGRLGWPRMVPAAAMAVSWKARMSLTEFCIAGFGQLSWFRESRDPG